MKKNFDDVKSIEFEVIFKGKGCVNYDSKEQKFSLINLGLLKGKKGDNVKYAKKIFEMMPISDNDTTAPKAKFKYKVSSDSLRHDMYKKEMEFSNTNISLISDVLFNSISQPSFIERGYMFASSTSPTIRKKSAFTITDAIEEGEWHTVVDFDIHSRSGERGSNDNEGNLSLSFCENVGNHYYKATGHIDLTELQFISADPIYDRAAVMADGGNDEKTYLTALRNNFNEDLKFDFYYMKNALTEDEWAERGILLNKEAVDKMVKDILKRIFNISIYRRDASFIFDSIKLKVNHGKDKLSFEEIDSNELSTVNDVDNFNFNYYTKYLIADENKIMKNRETANENKKPKK